MVTSTAMGPIEMRGWSSLSTQSHDMERRSFKIAEATRADIESDVRVHTHSGLRYEGVFKSVPRLSEVGYVG